MEESIKQPAENVTELRLIGIFQPTAGLNGEQWEVTHLPFVKNFKKKSRKKGQPLRSYWHVKSTGNYSDDCLLGRLYALEFLQYELNVESGCHLLGWIMGDMPSKLSGIAVGFCSTLHEYALKGAASVAIRRELNVAA